MTEEQIIESFIGIYSGGRAQRLRDAGNPSAMPPWTETYWLGKQVAKCPMDLWTYQEIIFETRPDVIIETGTSGGGSAFFFATLFDILGNGRVVTVDKDEYPVLWPDHPRIGYHVGDSVNYDVASAIIRESAYALGVPAGYVRVMVSLDSLHTKEHVARELELYAPAVKPGCYLVVEDMAPGDDGAGAAVADFLEANPHFEVDRSREKHLLTSNRGGWLKRKA